LPYNEEEIQFNNGNMTFAGTLTTPKTRSRHPALILITGSGPENRDEEIVGFKPFRILADHLTRHGIAVLRYDDRGVGGSTGGNTNPTTADFADDVESAVNFLKHRSDINTKQIGLCGHSEGGIVAAIVAARSSDIGFIVLMAGTAVSGDKIMSWQVEQLGRAAGTDEKEIQDNLASQNKVYAVVRSGKGWDDVREELKRSVEKEVQRLPDAQRKAISDEKAFIAAQVEQQVKGLQTPWFRYFIDFDPAPTLAKVKCPVLALFGELDTQVAVALNKAPMEKALNNGGNNDFTIRVLPKANHLFRSATTGLPSEYATLNKEFVSGFLDEIANWIIHRTDTKK
jgi:pimeloyl-ACP methyl ester carboxylesterase